MTLPRFWRTSLFYLLFLLSACGGGGGSGGGGSGGDGSDNDPANEPVELIPDNGIPLEYAGSTDAATITNRNLGLFVYAIMGQPGSDQLMATNEGFGGSLQSTFHAIHTSLIMGDGGKSVDQDDLNNRSTFRGDTRRSISAEISGSDLCEDGRINYIGDISPQRGTGIISMQFDDCREGGAILNGVAYFHVISFDRLHGAITLSTLSFKRLILTVDGVDSGMSGSIDNSLRFIQDDDRRYLAEVETMTADMVIEYGDTGKLLWVSDFEQKTERIPGTGSIQTLSGRIYHQDHGYVDVSGVLESGATRGVFTPATGKLRITGADDGILSTVEFLNEDILLVRLMSLGDSGFEPVHSALASAKPMSPHEMDNFADSDGDTMHDSWEEHFGLDPHDRNDARGNADGDALTNIEEYLRATPPNLETDTEASFSPISLSLASTTSSIFPTNRQVRFDFRFSMNMVYVDTAEVHIRFPTNFRVDSIGNFDYSNSHCQELKHVVNCHFETYNSGLSSLFAEFSVFVTLPEEAGQYDLGVLLVAYENGIPETVRLFTQPMELVPDFVDLEVGVLTEEDHAALDNVYRYTVVVRNVGTIPSESINLRLTYPDIVQRVSGSNDCVDGVCAIDFSFPSVAAQSSKSQHIEVYVPATAETVPQTIESSVTVIPGSQETNFSYVNNTNVLELVPPDSQMLLEARPYKNHVTREKQWDLTWKARWTLELGVFPKLTDHNGDYVEILTFSVSLPPGIQIDGELPSAYACRQSGNIVSCSVRGLADRWAQSVSLPLAATADGIYNYTATLTSVAIDDPADNTVQLATFVGNTLTGIQTQIDSADDSDTVEIPPGYYYGDLAYTKNINLVSSSGPEQTFISSLTNGIQPGAEGSISGLTFTYGSTAITLNNSDVQVTGNIFDHLNNNSDYSWGTSFLGFLPGGSISIVRVQGDSQPVIERNIVRDTNCISRYTGAFLLEGTSAPIIRNNLMTNSHCVGVNFNTLTPGAPVIVNNTFVNSDIGLLVPESARTAGVHVSNNIIYGNNVGIGTETDCGAPCDTLQSNLLFGNGVDYMDSTDQTGINGNLSADPLFTDPENGDFTLQAGSPAIDTGSAANAPDEDLLGNLRPVDGNDIGSAEPDIGAYEFN